MNHLSITAYYGRGSQSEDEQNFSRLKNFVVIVQTQWKTTLNVTFKSNCAFYKDLESETYTLSKPSIQ